MYHLQFNNTKYLMSLRIADKYLTQLCRNVHALNSCLSLPKKMARFGNMIISAIQIASVESNLR